MVKFFKQLKRIIVHKWWVFYYGCKCGIPFRAFLHDFSKLSYCELHESVKYYDDKISAIVKAKEKNGYSKAWLHHRGRNRHHYEYWYDNFDRGGHAHIMPFKESVEMFCDYMAAGRVYQGKDFSFKAEYDWWIKTKPTIHAMHIVQKLFISQMLLEAAQENKLPTKERLKDFYDYVRATYEKN